MGGKLTALKVKGLTRPGRYGDGSGLWIQVRDPEHRSWLFRYTVNGRQRQMGLGPLPDVTLADAREAAGKCRAALREGIDPIERRRKDKADLRDAAGAMTFRQVADRYLAAHEAAWTSVKHRRHWRATLDLAHAAFGERSISSVTTGDVMRVLEPIWHEKPETASRLRGRMEAVLDYAAARGWRSGDNPARWRGHLAKLLPMPTKIARVQHHAALPWPEIGAFMAELRDEASAGARALEFLILTACRTSEAIGARWSEINMPEAIWIIPAERMKADREHRVPLSDAALDVLRTMLPARVGDDAFVFLGTRTGMPLSNMAMMMLLRRMGRGDLTVHGFRSTFRDWAAETTGYTREVAEQALAHALENKVEAAYRRGDLFEKRRRLMADWAQFCAAIQPRTADVVPLHARMARAEAP